MDKNTQQPVLTVITEPDYFSRGHFYEGKKPYIDQTLVWKLPVGTKLYTAPPVPRDVLLAFGEDVRSAIHEYNGVDISAVDLAAIVDAIQPQADMGNHISAPVNQLLAALKHCHGVFSRYVEHHAAKGDRSKELANAGHRDICATAIAAAESAQAQQPCQYCAGKGFEFTDNDTGSDVWSSCPACLVAQQPADGVVQDAERYRWLRNTEKRKHKNLLVNIAVPHENGWSWKSAFGETMDAAIDAALAAHKAQEGGR